jgi:hypothetical protein
MRTVVEGERHAFGGSKPRGDPEGSRDARHDGRQRGQRVAGCARSE